MAFTMRIETDNAVFDDRGAELARILRLIADEVELADDGPAASLRVRDCNGDIVGAWTLERRAGGSGA